MIGVGCPVRNRAWVLPRYLESITHLEYDKKRVVLFFLVNDSEDGTLSILDSFRRESINDYADIIVVNRNYNFTDCDRNLGRTPEKFEHFTKIRNDWISLVRYLDLDYIFSVDSDVLVPKNSLASLIKNNKDICSMVLHNSNALGGYGKDITNLFVFSGVYENLIKYPQDSLFQVDVTGSAYLIKRKVLDQVEYKSHPLGEDFGFCIFAKQCGFEIWCDSSLYGEHVLMRSDF
jgi:hypothetical protein